MTELLFLHFARRLVLVDTCIKFREYSLERFLSFRADMFFVMDKVPRKITVSMSHIPKGSDVQLMVRHNQHSLYVTSFWNVATLHK